MDQSSSLFARLLTLFPRLDHKEKCLEYESYMVKIDALRFKVVKQTGEQYW
ncbi:hypothetical protein HanIR_Chr13g0625551 [Helianthus annuus]|nr:hypothetical protein HanIR_Chr13g0625551 [Helianthus annuus]